MANKFSFRLRTFLIGVTVTAAALGLLVPVIQQARQRAMSAICEGQLSSVYVGIYDYEQAKGTLPPAYLTDANDRPVHSWRVLILPYLGYHKLYAQYDFSEPWNGPRNRLLASQMPREYRCAANRDEPHKQTADFVAVVGPQTAWPGETSVKLTDIADDASSTLLLVEIAQSDIHWMEPRDMSFDDAITGVNVDTTKGISSTHAGQVSGLMVSGEIRLLSKQTLPETIRELLTIAGGDCVSPNTK